MFQHRINSAMATLLKAAPSTLMVRIITSLPATLMSSSPINVHQTQAISLEVPHRTMVFLLRCKAFSRGIQLMSVMGSIVQGHKTAL